MIINSLKKGVDISGLTAAESDVRSGKTFIGSSGEKATGSMGTASLPQPSIDVSSGGLITARYSVGSGYSSGGGNSKTQQLSTQAGKTVTPGSSRQLVVSSGKYVTGDIYVDAAPKSGGTARNSFKQFQGVVAVGYGTTWEMTLGKGFSKYPWRVSALPDSVSGKKLLGMFGFGSYIAMYVIDANGVVYGASVPTIQIASSADNILAISDSFLERQAFRSGTGRSIYLDGFASQYYDVDWSDDE